MSAISTIIYNQAEQNIFHEFGIVTDPKDKRRMISYTGYATKKHQFFTYKNQELAIRSKVIQKQEHLLYCICVLPVENVSKFDLRFAKINQLFSDIQTPVLKFVRGVISVFDTVNKHITLRVNSLIHSNKQVTLALLKLESLNTYLELNNIEFRSELERSIHNTFSSLLSKDEQYYTLSLTEYLFYFIDSDTKSLEKKFKSMTIDIMKIRLQYKVYFVQIDKEISDIADVWDKFFT